MDSRFNTPIADWLNATPLAEPSVYKTTFAEHHLGNIWIRSLHGGVTGSFIELCAEAETRNALKDTRELFIISSTIDYLRITKDADLYGQAKIERLSRRLSVVDVYCWQDDEKTPVARGSVTIKINTHRNC